MLKRFAVYLQYLLPQHCLTALIGKIANSTQPWIKNSFIRHFIKAYKINMSEALNEDPYQYVSFNDFFTRQLKPELRPIASGSREIASPVDGTIAQIGQIKQKQLLQVKEQYFDLDSLLAGDSIMSNTFIDGSFTTLYLAPHNYHRVHMPLTGKLMKTIFVPGKLFSVNQMTTALIPHLYSRNERYISLFMTETGPMAVILVGALIVGSIETAWSNGPVRSDKIETREYADGETLVKGAELGCFKLGSTVILLMPKNTVEWLGALSSNSLVRYGEVMGDIKVK